MKRNLASNSLSCHLQGDTWSDLSSVEATRPGSPKSFARLRQVVTSGEGEYIALESTPSLRYLAWLAASATMACVRLAKEFDTFADKPHAILQSLRNRLND
jgi:hypothetical protein